MGDVVADGVGGATYALEEDKEGAMLRDEDNENQSYTPEVSDDEDSLSQHLSDGDGDDLDDFQFPEFKMGLNSAVCLQNLPITSQDNHSKLQALVLKICTKIDGSIVDANIYLPCKSKTDSIAPK